MTIPLDPNTRRLLENKLRQAFPDAHVEPQHVEAVAACLHEGKVKQAPVILPEQLPPELRNLDFSGCALQLNALARSGVPDGADDEGVVHVAMPGGKQVRYYWVEATHTRQHPVGFEPFVGRLPMVRHTLPATTPATVETAIGTLEPADHLIATVHEANDKFASTLGYQLQRVDVTSPPRQKLRFGAISVYLGYRDANAAPSCYILEAGTATGQAKVLYLGRTIDATLNQYSGYKPTPFACSDNAYTGSLTLSQDSPAELHITARKILNGQNQPPYMDLRARFWEETTTIRNVWSGLLMARAIVIVLARHTRGIPDGCEKKALPS